MVRSSRDVQGRSDAEWLAALRDPAAAGDEARHELRVFLQRRLGRALQGRAAAHVEDFVQEAMIRILHGLEQFRGDSRFTTWALAIASRVAWNELRHERWKDVSLDALTADRDDVRLSHEPPGLDDSAERRLARQRVVRTLEEAVAGELTPRQRTVILAELRGMPQEEIATTLETNRNALYKLGHDARRALGRALARRGLAADEIRWAFGLETTA